MSLENEINNKIAETKNQLKELKKLKKMKREYDRIQSEVYKPPIRHIVSNWIDSVCLTFENIVKGDKQ